MKGLNRFQLTIAYLTGAWSFAAIFLMFFGLRIKETYFKTPVEQAHLATFGEFFIGAGAVLIGLFSYFCLWKRDQR
jgi:hypothetical protein